MKWILVWQVYNNAQTRGLNYSTLQNVIKYHKREIIIDYQPVSNHSSQVKLRTRQSTNLQN